MPRLSRAGLRRRGRQLLLAPVLAVGASVVVLPADADVAMLPHSAAPPIPAYAPGPQTFRATPPAYGRPAGVQTGRKSH